MKNTSILLIAVSFLVLELPECTNMNGGIGHEGEAKTITGKVFYGYGGKPAAGAKVYISDQNYVRPMYDTAQRRPDTLTDSMGIFVLTSVAAGHYAIEVNDGKAKAAFIRCTVSANDTLVSLPPDTLKPTGAITGTVVSLPDSSIAVYIQVYGLERVCRIDSSTGVFLITDVPQGVYTLRIVASSSLYAPKEISGVFVSSGVTADIGKVDFLPVTAWKSFKNLHLNTTASGANVTGTVTGFPVLVRLTDSNFVFSQAQDSGRDIRFVKADNTPLPYEIERWDASQALAEIWVKLDTVYGNDSAHYITMYWGNSTAASASNSAAVFDTANGFQGVWHMAEAGNTTAYDATGNHYNGVPAGMSAASAVTGAIGGAQQFNGASSCFAVPGTASSRLSFPENGHYTLSAWVYADSLDNSYHQIFSKGDQQYGLQLHNINQWQIFEFADATGWKSVFAPATAKAWKFIVGVIDGANEYLYVDGILANNSITLGNNTTGRDTSFDAYIGRRSDSPFDRYWKGMIDEVCVSGMVRSADWIKLCYMNQKTVDMLVRFK